MVGFKLFPCLVLIIGCLVVLCLLDSLGLWIYADGELVYCCSFVAIGCLIVLYVFVLVLVFGR